jgi:hypothetical protein
MIFYYKEESTDTAYWLNDKDEFMITPFYDMPKRNRFEMFGNYNQTEKDLRQFKKDLIQWSQPLTHFKFLLKNDNREAIYHYFLSKSTNTLKLHPIEDIDYYEYQFIEDCHNGGQSYFNGEYKDKPTECFGYDEKMFYPNLLCDEMLQIPLAKGNLSKLEKIPEKFEYGIYRCKVLCDNPDIVKVFAFSKKHTYTSISLNNALFLKYKKKMDITIELLIDCEYNALIYDKTVNGKVIFGNWLKFVKILRESDPKNQLYKYLSSSLWGEITRYNQIVVDTIANIELDDYIIKDLKMYSNRKLYYLLPKNNIYKRNLARIKPFLVSLSRYYICNLIYKNHIINNIIRIQVDGIVINKEVKLKDRKYCPILEEKTTGLITWYNVNSNDRIKEKNEKRKLEIEEFKKTLNFVKS